MYSAMHSLSYKSPSPTPGIGIKYVWHGEEIYTMEGRTYAVNNGSCLTVNAGQIFTVEIEQTNEAVKGMCFYVDEALLQEVNLYHQNQHKFPDDIQGTQATGNICEKIFPASDVLSTFIKNYVSLQHRTDRRPADSSDLFYGLALQVLLSQRMLRREMMQIKALRYTTREELYRRLDIARQLMEASPGATLSIAEIAAEACLSQYHFIRSFRQLYGISPYQYHLKKRLRYAAEQLSSDLPLSEIAHAAGFPDAHSFSTAFKRVYGITPANIKKENEHRIFATKDV